MSRSCSVSTRGALTRGAIAGGAIALVAACLFAAPSALASDQDPTGATVTAPSAPTAAEADSELGRVLDSGPELLVDGERLNVGLLRRFYARHGFAPVWTTRPAQAQSLIKAVLRAGEQGLAPRLFHARLLQSSTLPAMTRDLVLSDAFLSYADALARGAVPVEQRRDDETLTPGPVDVAAALDAAIAAPDPAAAIEALAPTTPTYRALQQALRNVPGGVRGRASQLRLRQIAVNLERERWLPRHLPPERVWVNAADERLVYYRDGQPVFSTKVVVGQDVRQNQSPEFQAMINGIYFNPPWVIPKDIATNEILPKAERDENYLELHHLVMLPDGTLQQLAGPNSGLGQMLLDMRNRFDVYLHDTPSKYLFTRDDRRVSHGCIRVENLQELAALLMRQPVEAIDQAIATGNTTRPDLPAPVPVFVVYETAFADADGTLQFRPDVYGRDAEIWSQLDPERQPLVERRRLGRGRG